MNFRTDYSEAERAFRDAEARAERGFIQRDPFCRHCGCYKTEHAGGEPPLCLFSPTTYERMTRQEWQEKMRCAWQNEFNVKSPGVENIP